MDDHFDSESTLAPEFTHEAAAILSRETVYSGFFTMQQLRLRHRLYRGGWSEEITRELFVRGSAVGVLLYDPQHQLVALTEQFRIGALESAKGPWCLEVVAGMIEKAEHLEQVARREVREEAGLEITQLHPIRSYLPSPGGSSERMHLFCATTDLRTAEGYFGQANEHEDIRLRVLPLSQVLAALHSETNEPCVIDNAATIISLQWLQLYGAQLGSG